MFHGLLLPDYNKVSKYEGKGNFAVRKYYKLPYAPFYRHKLNMILDMMDKNTNYNSVLDYGAGKAELFKRTLEARARKVKCVDIGDRLDKSDKFDMIVCASVLEFVNLNLVIPYFKSILLPGGSLVGASPMDTPLSRLYFKLIKDGNKRNSDLEILRQLHKHFWVVKKKKWLGLYFSFRAYPK